MDQSSLRNTASDSWYTNCNRCGTIVMGINDTFVVCNCGQRIYFMKTNEQTFDYQSQNILLCLPCNGNGTIHINGSIATCQFCDGTGYARIINKEETSMSDIVSHPTHYNKGRIEPIDVIEDWKLSFNLGNTVKYISRAPHKANQVEDLKKAYWYLTRELVSMLNVNRQDLANILMNIKR